MGFVVKQKVPTEIGHLMNIFSRCAANTLRTLTILKCNLSSTNFSNNPNLPVFSLLSPNQQTQENEIWINNILMTMIRHEGCLTCVSTREKENRLTRFEKRECSSKLINWLYLIVSFSYLCMYARDDGFIVRIGIA